MTEELRNLNLSSGKASSWTVRVMHPRKSHFMYGAGLGLKMHTLDCFLVGEDPALYCGGVLKSKNEADVKAAVDKFKEKTVWTMTKVGFDTRTKPVYMSFPHKFLVDMKMTTWKPLLEGIANMPAALVPATSIKQILSLREQQAYFDIIGVIVAGPTQERNPTTKRGVKRIADFTVRQECKDGTFAELEISAWEPLCDTMAGHVGHWVCLHKVEARVFGDTSTHRKISCETAQDALVLRLPHDEKRESMTARLLQCAPGEATRVTSQWEASESAIKVVGPQPLVCAGFLSAIAGSTGGTDAGPATWQMCGGYVDVPTGTITTQDGARVWFSSSFRDGTGDVEVFVSEAPALALANVKSRVELMRRFEEGSLIFPRCSVRGGKVQRNGKIEYRIVEAWSEPEVRPLTNEAIGLMNAMKVCGGTAGGIVPTAVCRLAHDPFAGLQVNNHPVRKGLIFVKGVERTTMSKLGEQRKMSSKVQCVFHDEPKDATEKVFTLLAYCHEQAVADFKFDKGYALALATATTMSGDDDVSEASKEHEVVVDNISIVMKDDVPTTRQALQTMLAAASGFPIMLPVVLPEDVASIHNARKRCKTITTYPSDPGDSK